MNKLPEKTDDLISELDTGYASAELIRKPRDDD
jgi:hypothetical protein